MDKSRELIRSIRKIIRSIDLHSNQLVQRYGLTGPQLVICSSIIEHKKLTVTRLSSNVDLSKATVVSILDRLEGKSLIVRCRDTKDKRQVFIQPTEKLSLMFKDNPPQLLQDFFIERFDNISGWEQSNILSAFERVAEMMKADQLDASPLLHTSAKIQA